MDVSLTPELERWIEERVERGFYANASEVVRESLRLLSEAEEIRERRIGRLGSDIRLGLDQLDRGEGIPGEQVLAEVTARLGPLAEDVTRYILSPLVRGDVLDIADYIAADSLDAAFRFRDRLFAAFAPSRQRPALGMCGTIWSHPTPISGSGRLETIS